MNEDYVVGSTHSDTLEGVVRPQEESLIQDGIIEV